MALSQKQKELVGVGISVAAGCKPCMDYHVKEARKSGASSDDLEHAIIVAMHVRHEATDLMEAHAFAHLGLPPSVSTGGAACGFDQLATLISVGAAFAVNCTSSLEQHLAEAEARGVAASEVKTVLGLAAVVEEKAASHVDRLKAAVGREVQIARKNGFRLITRDPATGRA